MMTLTGNHARHAPTHRTATARDLIDRVRSGLPIDAVDAVLAEGWLTLNELDEVVLPRKTLSHRRKLGLLTPDQSDRLSRVTRIIALARETFGNDDKAKSWLRRPTAPLGGESPLQILDTDQGVREVETLLGKISHGIAA
ncbi:MAG: type II RES/Xre toxin-antitoxin system antitoxin [Janthinobacterium lividum]